MNLIKKEKERSKKYMLKVDDDGLVELTEDNVARVEAMISTDSKYKNMTNASVKDTSGYWGSELKEILFNKVEKTSDGHDYEEIVGELIKKIDAENSTHLNSHKSTTKFKIDDVKGIKNVKERILEIDKRDLEEFLKHPKDTGYELINIINNPVPGENHHFSFATKFCHYACLYLFDNEYADNFSIYDNVLEKALPKYVKKYLNEEVSFSKEDYGKYIDCIDRLRNKLKEGDKEKNLEKQEISRNGLDHLIWYFHK